MTDKARILIADDEAIEREALVFFSREDDRVGDIFEARNGIEALEKAERLRPDIIVLDLRMPGLDGLAAARAIRTFDKRVRLIFVTAFGDLESARGAFSVYADDFLTKPASGKSFAAAIDRAIEGLRNSFCAERKDLSGAQNLKTCLIQIIRQGEQEKIPDLIEAVFYRGRFSRTELPQAHEAAIALIEEIERELGEEIGMGYSRREKISSPLLRARSVEEIVPVLAEICIQLSINVRKAISESTSAPVARALLFIEKNWRTQLTLERVAREAGLSPCHFSRVFSETMGMGYAAFLRDKRVQKAKEYLGNVSLPLKKVCAMSGFSSQAYFTEVFKKQTGISPSEYRTLLIQPSSQKN